MDMFEFPIGATVLLMLAAETGDPTQAIGFSAAMRRMNFDRSAYRDDAPSIPMTMTPRAAGGGIAAGWTITLSAASSAALQPGYYGVDATYVFGGETNKTQRPALVRMRKAA